jgi:phenylpyruvate tautomerase PptA (4-oxalocrotonate tautomerase family)
VLDKEGLTLWDFTMPLAKIYTTEDFELSDFDKVSKSISGILSSVLKKSEDYIMCVYPKSHYQSFANNSLDPSIYVEIKNVGVLSPEVTSELTEKLTSILIENTEAPASRIYIEFQNSERHMWGWNGKTFHK